MQGVLGPHRLPIALRFMDASAFLSDSQIVLLGRSSLAFAHRYSGSETNGRQYRHDHALLPDSGRVAVGSKRRSARRPRILPERSNLYGLAVRAVVVLQIVQHLARFVNDESLVCPPQALSAWQDTDVLLLPG